VLSETKTALDKLREVLGSSTQTREMARVVEILDKVERRVMEMERVVGARGGSGGTPANPPPAPTLRSQLQDLQGAVTQLSTVITETRTAMGPKFDDIAKKLGQIEAAVKEVPPRRNIRGVEGGPR
jgi:hypothetical protein